MRSIKELNKRLDEREQEIERLKKREQECIDHYLVQCKYASEMEDKYITANNIINELEKENKQLKENRDSAINYIDQVIMYEISNFDYKKVYEELDKLIGILKR